MSQTSQFYTKAKVDEKLATKQDNLTIDTQLSTTSTNPVQNKAVTTAINSKQPNLTPGTGISIQNNIISSTLVIDNELSTISTNPAQNKVITEELNTKAVLGAFNGGGTGVDYSDLSNNLIATKGLTVNNDPMSFGVVGGAQKSAVGDGNATLNKLVCVDAVKNQLVSPSAFSSKIENGITMTNNGDVTFTLSGVATGNFTNFSSLPNGVNGHQLLYLGAKSGALFYDGYTQNTGDRIITQNGTNMAIVVLNGTDLTTPVTIKPLVIDLTQRYGSNEVVNAIIGSDTSTQVAKLLAFDPEIINNTDYDTGSLVPSKSAKLLSVGVNQWDEEWEVGDINANTGAVTTGSRIISKNMTRCIPNESYYFDYLKVTTVYFYDSNQNYIGYENPNSQSIVVSKPNASYFMFRLNTSYGTTYKNDICINISNPTINGKYYPSKRSLVALPNYEGHGVLKVIDGKVVADGTELYPDGNSKKRCDVVDLGTLNWGYASTEQRFYAFISNAKFSRVDNVVTTNVLLTDNYLWVTMYAMTHRASPNMSVACYQTQITIKNTSYTDVATFKQAMSGVYLVYELDTEKDITTPVYQSNFPVEQGGTLQFLDENNNPIAGLQGNEIFYQKNIKAFVEAFGEAIDWNPERIERLAKLSFTPEYVNIFLNPTQANAYAVAQVYNATFTIVISTALTGTANSSITFQDSEIDLSSFETQPAESIIDMDGKKASEEPITPNCNIASFVGRSYNGIVLWSLLHSGVNKVKVHFEQAIPLDSEGKGKLDCRANMIL